MRFVKSFRKCAIDAKGKHYEAFVNACTDRRAQGASERRSGWRQKRGGKKGRGSDDSSACTSCPH
eukprot:6174869-Pleurochrysis_carterae.AAC.6